MIRNLVLPLTEADLPLEEYRTQLIFMGEVYDLSIEQGVRNSCRLGDGVIVFTLREMTLRNFNSYARGYLRRRIHRLFSEILEKQCRMLERFGYDLPLPRVELAPMRLDWAMCYYTEGRIVFSYYLASVPLECIEHIILHELCHFFDATHDELFCSLMELFDPEWRSKQRQLSMFASQYNVIPRD